MVGDHVAVWRCRDVVMRTCGDVVLWLCGRNELLASASDLHIDVPACQLGWREQRGAPLIHLSRFICTSA